MGGILASRELFASGPVAEATAWLLSNQSGSGHGLLLLVAKRHGGGQFRASRQIQLPLQTQQASSFTNYIAI